MVAVLPQSADIAQEYLNSEGFHVDQVKQTSMGELGVRGTPTLLLVNSAGVVTKVWIGRLQPQEQEQVLSVLSRG